MKSQNNQHVQKNGRKTAQKHKKANEIENVSDKDIEYFETMLKYFSKAGVLGALQDVDGLEKLYIEAKRIIPNNKKNIDKEIALASKLILDCIEMLLHFSKGLKSNLLNEPEKSFQKFKTANDICNTALKEFKNIENIIDKESVSFFSTLNFLFEYYRLISSNLKESSSNALQRKKGKYISHVEQLRNSAIRLREANNIPICLDDKDEYSKDLIVNMLAFVNRMADTYENNAERIKTEIEIINNNKEIKFLQPIGNNVFIVHGHDTDILHELKDILKNECNIEPIILKEKPSEGKTIIEKFEHHAGHSGFALVIITPDDLVENNGEISLQGRPNVLFELGWFCGRYGRNRVRILKKKGTEIPSDLAGIETYDFHEKLEEIFRKIRDELKLCGIIKEGEKNG